MYTKTPKIVGYWLLLGAFLVITMVTIGGITRLTHSGLSMVTWKPVTGVIPPLNEKQWLTEFNEYKTSPEYIKKNYHFTLKDFKSIFIWEYIHRLLGRILGFVFLIPFLFFFFTKKLKKPVLVKNLIIIFLLGGLQGFIGWFMVKSGLINNPNVSHYRLALHLSTALFLYSYILWTALGVFYPNYKAKDLLLKPLSNLLKILLIFLGIQIVYGAFVAGLKAGLIFNTFPKMGAVWFPNIINSAIHKNGLISLTNNMVSVQFIHRWMAVIVFSIAIYIFIRSKKLMLSFKQRRVINFLFFIVIIQFLLGVFTLLNHVPILLGILHQLGGVALLTTIVTSLYFFKRKV